MRFLFLLLALVFSPAAFSQTWPAKPVRVIVNVAAGGGADVTARVLSARLAETLGQGFLVENRAGGDGYIGFAAGRVSLYVIAHPEQPFKNFREFLAYARANPGKLNYGSPGNGTSPHIATEVFNREAKVKLNHVPYNGAGPALQDLLGGQIQLVFDPGVGLAPARAGKVRMIAIAGPKRHADFPDVP